MTGTCEKGLFGSSGGGWRCVNSSVPVQRLPASTRVRAEPEPGPEPASQPEFRTEPGQESGEEQESDEEQEPAPQPEPQSGPESDLEPGPEQEPQSGPEQGKEPGPEPEPEQEPQSGPEQGKEPGPEQEPQSEPEPGPEPGEEPQSGPEPGQEPSPQQVQRAESRAQCEQTEEPQCEQQQQLELQQQRRQRREVQERVQRAGDGPAPEGAGGDAESADKVHPEETQRLRGLAVTQGETHNNNNNNNTLNLELKYVSVFQTTDSPRGPEASNISRVADQLLQAVKGMEPHMVASMLSELRSDPQMAHRVGLDAEIKEILHLLGGPAGAKAQEKADDIDDEEKFLYGDSEEPKPPPTYGLLPGASTHLQAPPTAGDVEVRYASRSSISPDQNITVQVLNSALPPGMEPLEEGERQALEEYEKIQDLLKTIGLDLGVTEISKMAARTKERLHGNKPPPKMHGRRYSSGSSNGSQGRRRRSRSSSSSSSRSRGREGSSSSDGGSRRSSAPPKSHKDIKEPVAGQSVAAPPPHKELPPQTPDPNLLLAHPRVPIPPYPPSQVHGMMPPNFPPPGYSQYGNYLPYMHQQWPPMYPPPNMALPPQTGPDDLCLTRSCAVSNSGLLLVSAAKTGRNLTEFLFVCCVQVLEEREKLKQERDVRMKKKEYLMKELERLRKQQGELLRKKRREKGGHKDPLLQEISHLQEEVMAQISNLRKEHEAAEKKRNEIEKIALILGLIPSDRPRRAQTAAAALRASPDEPPADAPTPPPEPFEYYDAGNHWCKNCNVTSGSMFDYFTHLHSKTHRKVNMIGRSLYCRRVVETGCVCLAAGSEFLLPVRGFFCLLCKQFYGDAICAEEHVTTHAHNEKYKKQMYENPLYEQRRNLDRQAGLASEASGKKRKHEDEDKSNKDEKAKHKKEKRDKDKKKEESDAVQKEEKIKKEEDEEKPSKKEEEFKNAKSLEEERPLYSKKDEEDKFKSSKKDDKYRSSREEEERGKHSRKDDDDRHKYREEECRYRYRRDEEGRYDSRPKYGSRDDEYKYGLYSDFRSKHDEGKLKAEKEAFKKLEPGKTDINKPEPPPKPYDPPKILCGPSPAMRAKLRKQSLETGKPPPPAVTATPSFGKFTWKKKESILAKEAEKVAAEFIKEDEAATKQNPVSSEDSFAKSMAVAKEIAHKLGGQNTTPPWVFNRANRGRIRPNLPAPAAVLRKTAMMGPAPKEQPLFCDGLTRALNAQNALLENKPQPLIGAPGTSDEAMPPPPVSRPAPLKAKLEPLEANSAPPVCNPAPPGCNPAPPVCNPAPPVCNPAPPGCNPAPPGCNPAPPGCNPAPPGCNPAPPVRNPAPPVRNPAPPVRNPAPPVRNPAPPGCNPAPPGCNPAPPGCNPAPPGCNPAPPGCNPAPIEAKPAPSVAKLAQPTMVKIVSDVAAPGVPEDEQTHMVFVKPPPFMNIGDGPHKSDKLKSNLAAAKAQDLFNIFYNRVGQSGASSITKPATDNSPGGSSTSRSQLPTTQAPKPQPLLLTQSQPPSEVCKSLQPESQSPQTRPEPVIQIESVWSLQSSPTPPPEVVQSETQPRLNPPAQSEAQSAPQNQSWTPKSQSQTKPAERQPTPQTLSPANLAPQIHTDPQPDQDIQPLLHLETHPDMAPEHPPKPGPKTRGKATPTKRTPPAPRAVRQTRSQTRYQTRQQQSQSEPELASGDFDSAASDSKGLDSSDPGSGLLLEEATPSEQDLPMMEITPETLGLPTDMTSLDFDYDFNFE
uniref:U1-type domain-containing protein n=1 Tax=Cyclopterus lumpus TaxID=8103 RepID=A0A8C2WGQ9_CYCLU